VSALCIHQRDMLHTHSPYTHRIELHATHTHTQHNKKQQKQQTQPRTHTHRRPVWSLHQHTLAGKNIFSHTRTPHTSAARLAVLSPGSSRTKQSDSSVDKRGLRATQRPTDHCAPGK